MKKLQMPDLSTPKPTRFLIRGGWILNIPDFYADPDYERWLTGKLMPKHRHDAEKARRDARFRIDASARHSFLHAHREFLVRRAVEYGKRFPHKVRPDRTLEGFDPAVISEMFIPHHTEKTGRNGRTDIRNLLARFAQ